MSTGFVFPEGIVIQALSPGWISRGNSEESLSIVGTSQLKKKKKNKVEKEFVAKE